MDNEYAKEITKQAVARACVALDIKSVRSECIDVIADVVRYYTRTVAIGAREAAENSGRAYAGIQDILRLEPKDSDMHWSKLASFALDTSASPANDDGDDDNAEKASKWNHKFPVDIDPFPEDEPAQPFEAFDLNEDSSRKESYVPPHLPVYPPSHTIEKKGSKRKQQSANSTAAAAANKKIRPDVIKNASNIAAKIEEAADSIATEVKPHHHHPKH